MEDPQICAANVSEIYQDMDLKWKIPKSAVLIVNANNMFNLNAHLIMGFDSSFHEEAKRRPLPDYIEIAQKDVSPNLRAILVDLLVEVAEECELHSDTLQLFISYIDRFLSTNDLNRQKLLLLGVSSMLITSKYEKINHPPVDEFCYLTDNAYTKKEVVKIEAGILKHLKFEVGSPTILTFLGYYCIVNIQSFFSSVILQFNCLINCNALKISP
ncbi:hypothetical protein HYC85_012003 [Camellia sinensis]|uniref:Cyclin-like domain-containing protein n=1 Tax=Camellia sinensis TaxID=4442 RepID=A0A7J7HAP9_CAMSI|nr:hypothetical protein HYC85_012003 [Camellia sinensis]